VIPKTIVLVFPELVLKGPPEWENGARIGPVPSQITYTPKASFPNQIQKTGSPKTGVFPVSPYSSLSKKRSANQKGVKRPVFLPVKSVISDSTPANPLSENM
jgi:hypothetical protein